MSTVEVVKDRTSLRVLVPVTQPDQNRLAVDLAKILTADPVTVLYVLPSSHHLLSDLVEEASTVTGGFHVPRDSSGKPEGGISLRFGELETEIIRCADDFDLIVMAINPDEGTDDERSRNVAGRVAYASQTPILLFRPFHYPNGVKVPGRIVVPLDGSEMAEAALKVASNLSRRLNATIELVHVLDLGLFGKSTEARQNAVQAISEYLRTEAIRLQQMGVTTGYSLLYGCPAYSILDNLSARDMVILSTHGPSRSDRWLMGSTSTLLLKQGVCPVLLVPPEPCVAVRGAATRVDQVTTQGLEISPVFDS